MVSSREIDVSTLTLGLCAVVGEQSINQAHYPLFFLYFPTIPSVSFHLKLSYSSAPTALSALSVISYALPDMLRTRQRRHHLHHMHTSNAIINIQGLSPLA
jgi:hypothetical protein